MKTCDRVTINGVVKSVEILCSEDLDPNKTFVIVHAEYEKYNKHLAIVFSGDDDRAYNYKVGDVISNIDCHVVYDDPEELRVKAIY